MLRFLLALIVVVLAQAVQAAQAIQAEERDVLRRLMAEPLTLFDWGMAQLDRDMAYAARRTLRGGFGLGEPRTGAVYDWRTRQVTIYATIALPRSERTEQVCAIAFQDIVATLIEAAPQGPDAAGWYLLSAFQPQGHYWASRFEDIGEQLLALVRLEVALIPATPEALGGDTARVRCAGRLDAGPAEIAVEVTS